MSDGLVASMTRGAGEHPRPYGLQYDYFPWIMLNVEIVSCLNFIVAHRAAYIFNDKTFNFLIVGN